jgi:hypothetical protein
MNRLHEVITQREQALYPFVFRPKNTWFKDLGLSKKRFYAIAKNEVSPTVEELQRIAKEFGVSFQDLILSETETPATT